jgi:hypothetical protein
MVCFGSGICLLPFSLGPIGLSSACSTNSSLRPFAPKMVSLARHKRGHPKRQANESPGSFSKVKLGKRDRNHDPDLSSCPALPTYCCTGTFTSGGMAPFTVCTVMNIPYIPVSVDPSVLFFLPYPPFFFSLRSGPRVRRRGRATMASEGLSKSYVLSHPT